MTPAGTNLLLASATAAAPAPSDVVTKSLLFNSASSSKLTWTPASSSSATSYTISLWAKRGDLGAENCLFHAGTASGNRGHIRFNSDDTLELACYNGSWFVWVATTAVFRDPSAFYHICGEINTTNGTAKLYINGVQQTALSQNTANSSSTVLPFGANIEHQIGVRGFDSAGYFGGYAADIYGIDGTALTPTSFAEEDATTGQWKPKAFVGLYGTNGFHLDFKDSSDIGKDVSVDTYITATGGTVTTDGDYKVHTFNSTGTFEVTTGNDSGVEYLVLAGGGGGGGRYGGGGGAGGYRTATGFPVTATSYSATVGAGGAAGADTDTAVGGDGSDSSFSTITSDGGGGGGPGYATGGGRDGGSGGGSGYNNNASGVGGTATAGQGYDGGTNGGGSSNGSGGGGGGAGGVGANGHLSGADLAGGDGGTGVSSSITGTPTDLGGGGGAGAQVSNRGAGGTGGGGQGGDATAAPAAGTTNKGGGGGGGGRWQSGYGGGGAGGSGVVIIRYKFQ
jgi:hypothetical protein